MDIDTCAKFTKNWVRYIYELIYKNFTEYLIAYNIWDWTPEEIWDKLYSEILSTFKDLTNEITRVFWLHSVNRRIGNDNVWGPAFKLEWAKYRLMDELHTREMIKSRIMEEKRNNTTKWFFWRFRKEENQIIVSDEEIDSKMKTWSFPHTIAITEKWKEILNWYLRAVWRDDIDILIEKNRQLFNNICS